MSVNYGSYQGQCVICGGPGISDASYCRECTQLEKDRDGCPKIVNLGSSKMDLFYERKNFGKLFFLQNSLVDERIAKNHEGDKHVLRSARWMFLRNSKKTLGLVVQREG
ncbi:unnamed protein product [Peronospora belbahrii]|uniref:Uncharacterized protein n=1 Tax=Peronospora belbahrii TaxID=622444 RepID=A0AAU9L995_9STRA|nr:unnamed protein product [Peronospora belbahrii]